MVEYEKSHTLRIKAEIFKSLSLSIAFHTYQCIQRHITGPYLVRCHYTIQFIAACHARLRRCHVSSRLSKSWPEKRCQQVRFDYVNVWNMHLKNGRNEVLLRENLNIDIEHQYFLRLYQSYTAFKRVTQDNTDMLYLPEEFIQNRTFILVNQA